MEAAVAPAQQLVPTAHGEQSTSLLHGGDERLCLGGEVGGDEELLPVLSASDVEEIVRSGDDAVRHPQPRDLELVAAPLGPPTEDGHVAPVGVDVEVVGIQMRDTDRRHAARSQYGRTSPRWVTSRCRPSIAV